MHPCLEKAEVGDVLVYGNKRLNLTYYWRAVFHEEQVQFIRTDLDRNQEPIPKDSFRTCYILQIIKVPK